MGKKTARKKLIVSVTLFLVILAAFLLWTFFSLRNAPENICFSDFEATGIWSDMEIRSLESNESYHLSSEAEFSMICKASGLWDAEFKSAGIGFFSPKRFSCKYQVDFLIGSHPLASFQVIDVDTIYYEGFFYKTSAAVDWSRIDAVLDYHYASVNAFFDSTKAERIHWTQSPMLAEEFAVSEYSLALDAGQQCSAIACSDWSVFYVQSLPGPAGSLLEFSKLVKIDRKTRAETVLLSRAQMPKGSMIRELAATNIYLLWTASEADQTLIELYETKENRRSPLQAYSGSPDLSLSFDGNYISWIEPDESGCTIHIYDLFLNQPEQFGDPVGAAKRTSSVLSGSCARVNRGILSFCSEPENGAKRLTVYDLSEKRELLNVYLDKNAQVTNTFADKEYLLWSQDELSASGAIYLCDRINGGALFSMFEAGNSGEISFFGLLEGGYVLINDQKSRQISAFDLKTRRHAELTAHLEGERRFDLAAIMPSGSFIALDRARNTIVLIDKL